MDIKKYRRLKKVQIFLFAVFTILASLGTIGAYNYFNFDIEDPTGYLIVIPGYFFIELILILIGRAINKQWDSTLVLSSILIALLLNPFSVLLFLII